MHACLSVLPSNLDDSGCLCITCSIISTCLTPLFDCTVEFLTIDWLIITETAVDPIVEIPITLSLYQSFQFAISMVVFIVRYSEPNVYVSMVVCRFEYKRMGTLLTITNMIPACEQRSPCTRHDQRKQNKTSQRHVPVLIASVLALPHLRSIWIKVWLCAVKHMRDCLSWFRKANIFKFLEFSPPAVNSKCDFRLMAWSCPFSVLTSLRLSSDFLKIAWRLCLMSTGSLSFSLRASRNFRKFEENGLVTGSAWMVSCNLVYLNFNCVFVLQHWFLHLP